MPERDTHSDELFDQVGDEVSAAVTRAASVLEEELSAGIASARRLQEKLTADRRVDPAAFDEVAGRVRKDTHSLIDMVAAQLPAAGERGELTRRYAADAHDVLDSLIDLARLAPELANGLIERVSQQGRPPAFDDGPARVRRPAGAAPAGGEPGPVS